MGDLEPFIFSLFLSSSSKTPIPDTPAAGFKLLPATLGCLFKLKAETGAIGGGVDTFCNGEAPPDPDPLRLPKVPER
ncbi:hypothetical protein HDU97_010100 [Phlyctochytrium planicorne]|nr:hypothetical protein HDU97_010100 [Phlyctochytrium planicorne]